MLHTVKEQCLFLSKIQTALFIFFLTRVIHSLLGEQSKKMVDEISANKIIIVDIIYRSHFNAFIINKINNFISYLQNWINVFV